MATLTTCAAEPATSAPLHHGIVVIGRNEAERLGGCLASLPGDVPVCYVDSGSVDDSVVIAERQGVTIHCLGDHLPFSAARARNEGFDRLLLDHPHLEAVFFIDGDCTLEPGFLETALPCLAMLTDRAIIVGTVKETNARANVYGLLAALEWGSSGPGEILDFGQLGGIMLVRASDFRAVGGFDPSFIAGEDSELGIRLYLAGRKTERIDAIMACHAMEMERFGQWWRRSVRAGHALAHRNHTHGRSSLADSRSAVRSTLAYGVVMPVVTIASVAAFGGWGAAFLAVYAFLGSRFFAYYRRKRAGRRLAAIGAAFGVIAKLANAQGLIRFHIQRLRGSYRLIEYK